MITAKLIHAALLLPPKQALVLMAYLMGTPQYIEPLTAICMRESKCRTIGVHKTDAHLDGWGGQVKLGHLDPSCQPHGGKPYQWTTRGPWGLSAASHWQYLPRCYKPSILDNNLISAYVSLRKYHDKCGRRNRGWCYVRKPKLVSIPFTTITVVR